MSNRLIWLLKTAALCFAVIWISTGTADAACGGKNERVCKLYENYGFLCDRDYADLNGKCVECGGKGQPACAAMRKGPVCKSGLIRKKDGICRTRPKEAGEEGGVPRDPSLVRFQCDSGLAPHPNKPECVKCGELGQPACPRLRSGPSCKVPYSQENDAGFCEARGGFNEPKLTGIGYECRPGYNWDRGARLFSGSSYSDVCQPCGEVGQIVCEWGRDRRWCNPPYVRKQLFGERDICAFDIAKELEGRLMDEAKSALGVLTQLVRDAGAIESDEASSAELSAIVKTHADSLEEPYNPDSSASPFKSDFASPLISQQTSDSARSTLSSAESTLPNTKALMAKRWGPASPFGKRVSNLDTTTSQSGSESGFAFKSVTVGSSVEVALFGGATLETGLASGFDHFDLRGYVSGALIEKIGGGASLGGTVGFWRDEYDQLGGKFHGYSVSLTALRDYLGMIKGLKKPLEILEDAGSPGWDFSIAGWWAREDNNDIGRFLGFTATISLGTGADMGATYYRGVTKQEL